MMVGRVTLFLILILLQFRLSGQVKIEGSIQDSVHQAVSFATVQLIDAQGAVISFAGTDAGGHYQLSGIPPGKYQLRVNHLNFRPETATLEVAPAPAAYTKNFLLTAVQNQLKEVTVQSARGAARMKGDTLSYNLGAFTNGNEEKLKDILNKLPGIEVDENGKIKSNGKKVDKLLVNGKEFFGDNHQMATDNLSAKMIGGVDLMEHYESFGALKNIEGSNQTALNINIKEEYKGKLSGDLSLLGAIKDRYDAHAGIFRFDQRSSLSFIGDVNNTGQQAITLKDYLNMNSSIRQDIRNNDLGSTEPDVNNLPSFLLSDENVAKRSGGLAALNFNYMAGPKLNLNGFGIYSKTSQQEMVLSEKTYLNTTGNITGTDRIYTHGNFNFNQFKLNAEYKYNSNNLINYTVLAEPQKDNPVRDISSTLDGQLSSILERQDNSAFKLGQQLSYISRVAAQSLLTFNAYQEYQKRDNDEVLQSSSNLFGYSRAGFTQQKDMQGNEVGLSGKYTLKVNSRLFKAGAGYTWLNDEFKTTADALSGNSNEITFNKNYGYAMLSAVKNSGLLQYLAEGQFRQYQLNAVNRRQSSSYFLPNLQLKLEFKNTHYLQLGYKKNVSFASAYLLNAAPYLADYRSIYAASAVDFQTPLRQDLWNIRYFYFDLYSGTMLVVNSSWLKTGHYIVTNSKNEGSYNLLNYLNSPGQKRWDNGFTAEQRIPMLKAKATLSGTYSLSRGYAYINQMLNDARTSIYGVRVALKSNFEKAFFNYQAGFSYRYISSVYRQVPLKNNTAVYRPYLNVDGKISSSLSYHADNAYQVYTAAGIRESFYELDLKIKYAIPRSKWAVALQGNDVLNLNHTSVLRTSAQNNVFQQDVLSRLPGYIGVGLNYTLL